MYAPKLDMVKLLHANPVYPTVRLSHGSEAKVSIQDLVLAGIIKTPNPEFLPLFAAVDPSLDLDDPEPSCIPCRMLKNPNCLP